MDIICAKCGKHFSDIEAAREHRGHCKETSKDEAIRWIPAQKSKISPEEWERLMRLINPQSVSAPQTPDVKPTPIESTSPKDSTEPDATIPVTNSGNSKSAPVKKEAVKNKRAKASNYKIQNWLIALILFFALCVIGLGISLFVGILIPFWLLFIFSLVYVVEKWFYYFTRKYRVIGKLYRLLLNLSLLSLLGIIIWTSAQLFSQQFVHNPLVGSVIFLAELAMLVWMWKVVSKNSWRWPSMKLTAFSLVGLCAIFAFAGVKPFTQ
ncbi:MAG: hypothetical protein HYU85_08615, partial [Chloroflexi bacterium]|nr:hypothetical protein [Chloroflexota bacterium]